MPKFDILLDKTERIRNALSLFIHLFCQNQVSFWQMQKV